MRRLWAEVDAALPGSQQPWIGYVIAAAGSASAAAATLYLHETTGTNMPFLLGIGSVLFGSVLAGLVPGLIGAVLYLAIIAWMLPTSRIAIDRPGVAARAIAFVLPAIAGEIGLRIRRRARTEAWRCRQRDQYLQSIFHSLPAAMVVVNEDTSVLAANDHARALLDLGEGDLASVSLPDLVRVEGSACLRDILDRLAREKRSTDGITCVIADGTHRDLAIAVAPIDIAGRRYQTICFSDETPRRRALAELAVLQAEVAQLSRASALGQLGSAIAHELNQPLTSAALYAGSLPRLLKQHNYAMADKAATEAVTQIFRANAVLQRLRSFVRAAAPTMEWLPARVVIDDAVQLGRLAVRQARASLRVDIDPSVGNIFVDRVQIQQVIINLLSNAAEAIQTCERRELRLSVSLQPDGRALISVEDSGPGIDPAIQDRLFTPFTSTKESGLGIGLSISKSLVAAHGGDLWCESTSAGACFRLTVDHAPAEGLSHAA